MARKVDMKILIMFKTLFDCIVTSDLMRSNFDAFGVDLHAAFVHFSSIILEFRHVWDPGDASGKAMLYFRCEEKHMDHGLGRRIMVAGIM